MRRAGSACAAIVLAAATLAGCGGGGGGPRGYSVTVQGSVSVAGRDGTRSYASGRHSVVVGDTVRVVSGRATLTLPRHGTLELRSGRASSTVQVAATPVLVDGDALVRDASIRSGSASVQVPGVARLRRSSGVTVAVYEGTAHIDVLGQQLVTPAFRQAAVSDTGALPRRAVPLVYDRSNPDPWDVRYLGDAIDLGTQLDRRSQALSAELPAPTVSASLLTSVVPALRNLPQFGQVVVDQSRSVGETVVGASIALAGSGDFARRWNNAFTFRQEGADWGLVAADQRARRSSVFGVLDGVLNGVPAGPAVRRATATTTTTTTAPGPGSGPTTTTTTTPSQPSPTVPPLTIPLLPQPSSPPGQPTPTPTPTDALGQLLGGVLGLLDSPTR